MIKCVEENYNIKQHNNLQHCLTFIHTFVLNVLIYWLQTPLMDFSFDTKKVKFITKTSLNVRVLLLFVFKEKKTGYFSYYFPGLLKTFLLSLN